MNCHQILSGACNAGDRCFAVGSVEGIPFTVSNEGQRDRERILVGRVLEKCGVLISQLMDNRVGMRVCGFIITHNNK